MIGRVHEISVPVEVGADRSIIIDGKLCLEMAGQNVSRITYSEYANALGVDASASIFQVPDRSGRVAIGEQEGVEGREVGDEGGAALVAIGVQNMPPHNHNMFASSMPGIEASAEGNVLAKSVVDRTTGETIDAEYTTGEYFVPAQMHAGCIGATGGGQPISVMQPWVASRFFVQVEV